jgi:hypothetical protein
MLINFIDHSVSQRKSEMWQCPNLIILITCSENVGTNQVSFVLTTVNCTVPSTPPSSKKISHNIWKAIFEIPASKSIQVPSQNQNRQP